MLRAGTNGKGRVRNYYVGVKGAVASEPTDPQLLTNSKWVGGPPPTSWSTPISGTAVANGTVGDSNVYRFTAAAQRPFLASTGTAVTFPASGTTTVSVYTGTIYSGSVQVQNMVSFVTTPAGGTTQWKINGVNVAGTANATANSRISCTMTTTGTGGTSQVRIGPGAGSNATVDIDLSRPQANAGSVPSVYSGT